MEKGKTILITGVAGTVGKELLHQLTSSGYRIVGIDNDEAGLFNLILDYQNMPTVSLFLCDIRSEADLDKFIAKCDIIFHLAALKHVSLCEISPEQAVQTNILGTQNIVNLASKYSIEKVIFTSSDKAVNPTNVMGTSKLMAERIITSANANSSGTIFSSTRFGNVLGSSGSVVPIFIKQILERVPITITDFKMTRFVMSVDEAVNLILKASEIALGGEVIITKMPVLKIKDLATSLNKIFMPDIDIPMIEIGVKPGEKLYEELMTEEEMPRSLELENFFIVKPAYMGFYSHRSFNYEGIVNNILSNPYHSGNELALSDEKIREVLSKSGVSAEISSSSAKRYWPGESNKRPSRGS